ncbi:tetratricopeptide repeat protein [Halanaerobacter jeridensis]|uniref:Tetratricopeptide (TPR) repeat protein n=1 Tax=Halanaerobacter jeridensis TaxID=706427 RepID=A0A938XR94_9FIRM|nr:tetratricopeptide repeat protein [Halanaerobacter jeridensis]MBM7558147.1 tetratricopeptide (TPR) repeat protein [Halanaerobacter jeridensis]
MFNPVLWTLDNETDPFVFERLCSDLMYRNGFKNIVPLGRVHDRGRDAEVELHRGKNGENERVFFQYSLRKDWKIKLKKELEKVKKYGHEIDKFVFVTTQNVTGNQMDKLEEKAKEDYGWDLKIYHRDWLRLQLEEGNKDLAKKYLGIPEKYIENNLEQVTNTTPPKDQQEEKAWQLYLNKKYEKAIPKLKDLLDNSEDDKLVYNAIAGCYYSLYNYKKALKYINYSLDISSDFSQSLMIKGCILAEYGISSNSKHKLVLAKNIFEGLVSELDNWGIYYNLANTLSALGEYETAKEYYLEALEDNKNDLIWKNLGTCYYHLGNHEQEIECFDKALELNPSNIEALVSKGVTLAKVFNEYKEGLALLNGALKKGEELAYRWPHIWFWKARFLIELDNYEEALNTVNKGLEISPDYKALLNLKASILSELWRNDNQFIDKAKGFFEYKLEVYEKDINALRELSLLYKKSGEKKKALNMLVLVINYMSGLEEKINIEELLELDISFKKLIQLIKNVEFYCSYRESKLIEECFEQYKLKLNSKAKKVLWIIWGINFTKILKSINAPVMVNEQYINKLYDDSMKIMEKYIGLITKNFAQEYKKGSETERIDFLAILLNELPEIILREFSSQIGYLTGKFNFDPDTVDNALIGKGEKFARWLKAQIRPIISSADIELGLFEEE